jgi:hypothetical protein
MTNRAPSVTVLAAILVGAVACAPRVVVIGGPAGDGAVAGNPGDGSSPVADAGFGFQAADASSTQATGDAGGSTCAQEVHRAEHVPVDLLLLMDSSGSMGDEVGDNLPSKWELAQKALSAFVRDPRTAGVGVGVQFFPQILPPKECTSDTDCPSDDPTKATGTCQENSVCSGGRSPFPVPCSSSGATGAKCGFGATCVPAGRCTITKLRCVMFNQPCPGGVANDICLSMPRTCSTGPDFDDSSCVLVDYQHPAAPIAPLPGNEALLVQVIGARTISGGTPTGPAVKGALAFLRTHQSAHPDHRLALLLVTDGLPSSCTPVGPSDIAKDIRAAAMTTPAIPTYAIGVFAPNEIAQGRMALQQFASAGGTSTPFVLTATGDLSQKLQDALNQIRGATQLPCELAIPPARAGGSLDYLTVNLTWKGTAGAPETVPYVEAADRCDPVRGGWYYDVRPAAGTPSRIIVCETTCRRFQDDPAANVSVAIGCKTEVIR